IIIKTKVNPRATVINGKGKPINTSNIIEAAKTLDTLFSKEKYIKAKGINIFIPKPVRGIIKNCKRNIAATNIM
ncbi:MAG: hypothetical protein R3321_12055, partial [Nitrososphaeraceae archaeon]|nr:hypothetical protein [Nitrososphaeraceae archaeon]